VAAGWLSRSSAPLPTYGGLVLPHEHFLLGVPFDFDCKHTGKRWLIDAFKEGIRGECLPDNFGKGFFKHSTGRREKFVWTSQVPI
jgi:hypothetical protein